MNRRFVVLIILIAARQIASGQLMQQDNWVYNNLNGKVKSYTETINSRAKTVAPAGVISKRVKSFTDNGNVAKLEEYADGKLNATATYTYTGFSFTSVSQFVRKGKGKDVWVKKPPRVYTFDDGKRTETTKGGNEPTIVGQYNTKGLTVSESFYSPSGKLLYKLFHQYDGAGHILETNKFNPDGGLMARYTFQMDVNGRKVLEQGFDGAKKLKYVRSHKYDAFGNESEFRESVAADQDSAGKLLTNIKSFTYTYDNRRNWTRREEFNDANKLAGITERKITYY